MVGLSAKHREEKTVMIDATYLKAHRTATSMGVKKGARTSDQGNPPFLQGTRLTASAAFGSLGTQRQIAGLGPSDLIAPWVIKGAMDGPAFVAYIREALIHQIEPGTTVILDKLAIHKNKEAEEVLREQGCWFLFLPPYSPDLNPIKMAFSKLKAHLRRIGARSFTGLFQALSEICDLFTPQQCWNYFCEAGYAST